MTKVLVSIKNFCSATVDFICALLDGMAKDLREYRQFDEAFRQKIKDMESKK